MIGYEKDMYTAVYFYRVPKKNIDEFLMIQKESAKIYKKYGALEDWTFAAVNFEAKYGCASLIERIDLAANEELYFSFTLFKSKEDHDRVMGLVDSDPHIKKLFDQVCQLIDISRVVRGEFSGLA